MTIDEWIRQATSTLSAAGIVSARLDAEIILAHTLKKQRTYLHAHGDEALTGRELEIADARTELRKDRTPIAYIIGHKEFYGRLFKVTPATLIPRPESEQIITILKELLPHSNSLLRETPKRLVDIGTGSGCLGITAKLECPELEVALCDISNHALNVAKSNAQRLEADVEIMQSNLLASYPFRPDIVLANLPYVDASWERSPETDYEPQEALFAENNGQALIEKLIEEASLRLASGGLMLLEADPRQHANLVKYAKKHGFALSENRDFIFAIEKL
ncbi:MAG TPA: peptide chain release factor N(5)-glutamine methyltransferase [Verrucomicrobiae bacterium]|jgi:release factor glutamine methyltransferase|nr:peptide chain release factor N(5)-glutamine methyltransferase [Verrucomicrobiae bacterium]